jgi:glycosyltransferase involved in cell wall biosynthesis
VNVSLITPVLLEGDAVSNDVLGEYRLLKQAGYDVRLFADECHTALPCGPIDAAGECLGPEDLCIYHHSMGCTPAVHLLRHLPCRRLVRYHNVTPARYYADALKTKLECNKGVWQLRELVDMGCAFLATSKYTARDLTAIRPDAKYRIVPPYNQIDDLLRTVPDYLSALPFNDAKYTILSVGRLVPNKNLVNAVKGFALFHASVHGRARFVLAGDPGDGRYSREVTTAAQRLGISDDVVFTGKIGRRQLRALYLVADTLLLVSEHEGFGVPLVEAMALRVPCVASSTTALPETGDDAALYVDPTEVEAIGCALAKATCDGDLRETLTVRGRERYESFYCNSRIDWAVLDAITGVPASVIPSATDASATPFLGSKP